MVLLRHRCIASRYCNRQLVANPNPGKYDLTHSLFWNKSQYHHYLIEVFHLKYGPNIHIIPTTLLKAHLRLDLSMIGSTTFLAVRRRREPELFPHLVTRSECEFAFWITVGLDWRSLKNIQIDPPLWQNKIDIRAWFFRKKETSKLPNE